MAQEARPLAAFGGGIRRAEARALLELRPLRRWLLRGPDMQHVKSCVLLLHLTAALGDRVGVGAGEPADAGVEGGVERHRAPPHLLLHLLHRLDVCLQLLLKPKILF